MRVELRDSQYWVYTSFGVVPSGATSDEELLAELTRELKSAANQGGEMVIAEVALVALDPAVEFDGVPNCRHRLDVALFCPGADIIESLVATQAVVQVWRERRERSLRSWRAANAG